MSDSVLDSIAGQLESLGYQITKDQEKELFRARHQRQPNLRVREFGGGILFTIVFYGNDAAKSDEPAFLRCIIALNRKAVVARFYSNHDPNNLALFIEVWHPNLYQKAAFGKFFEALQRDIRLLGDDDIKIMSYLA